MMGIQSTKLIVLFLLLGVLSFAECYKIRFPRDDLLTNQPHHHDYVDNPGPFPIQKLDESEQGVTHHRRQRRSFDFGGLLDYAMGTIYSLMTHPYPYPSLVRHVVISIQLKPLHVNKIM